jgi:hypothetical protein
MRILGYIEHPRLKITAFKMDNRLSLKIEDEYAEETFKFRQQEGLSTLEDLQRLADGPFLKTVEQRLLQMRRQAADALIRIAPPPQNEFDTIL